MPKVRIVSNHTHNGVSYYPGMECEMEAEEAQSYARLVVNHRAHVPAPAVQVTEAKIVIEEKETPAPAMPDLFSSRNKK